MLKLVLFILPCMVRKFRDHLPPLYEFKAVMGTSVGLEKIEETIKHCHFIVQCEYFVPIPGHHIEQFLKGEMIDEELLFAFTFFIVVIIMLSVFGHHFFNVLKGT